MKLSNQPTTHILLRAYTNSNWDSCDFAILTISEKWKSKLFQRMEAARIFKGDESFLSVDFYEPNVSFFTWDDREPMDMNEEGFQFVELSEDEMENFSKPENEMDCPTLAVNSNGTALYKIYGSYTGEEFWTEEINLNKLLEEKLPCNR